MEIKLNEPINVSLQVNSTFSSIKYWGIYEDDWSKLRLEAASNYQWSFEFEIMAEVIQLDSLIKIRYNYQEKEMMGQKQIINLN